MGYPLNQFLKMLNAKNNSNLTDQLVTVGAPAKNTDASIVRDTVVTITAIPGKGYRGSVTVYYNRIDLGILFKNLDANVGLTVADGGEDSDQNMITLINQKYGTHFEVGDLVPVQLTKSEDIQEVTLVAVGGNLMYEGEFKVKYGIAEIALDSVVLITQLDGFNYPNADLTKGQASIYSYNLDGSAEPNSFWESVGLGAVDARFVTPFNTAYRVDEDWVFDAATKDFNLYGGQVVYSGTNDAAKIYTDLGVATNPTYKKVCIIKLGAECQNFAGFLTVYFGGAV